MRSSVPVKIHACADLIQMDLALGAGLFLVAGEILGSGGLPPGEQMLLGFLTLFFISGSANISNDYFDREVDRINLPTRPLPSGRISIREVWALFTLCTILGFITAAMLGPTVLMIVLVLWVIAFLTDFHRVRNLCSPFLNMIEVCITTMKISSIPSESGADGGHWIMDQPYSLQSGPSPG